MSDHASTDDVDVIVHSYARMNIVNLAGDNETDSDSATMSL